MNSHFQSSATTSTVSGFSPAAIGCAPLDPAQRTIRIERVGVDPGHRPKAMMISSGAAQITSSSWVEWSQSGV